MQVPIYWISEGFIGLLLIAITFVLVNYTRKRVAELPEGEKSAGRPLYLSALGIFQLGIASLIVHLSLTTYSTIDFLGIYYTLLMIGVSCLSIAALMILGRTRLYPIPTILLFIGVIVSLGVSFFDLPQFLLSSITGVLVTLLFFFPACLFYYLTIKTRRSTSLSFAIALTVYPLYPLFIVAESSFLVTFLLLAIRLFSTGVLFVAFLRPQIGISGEFWGYAGAGTIVTIWVSYIVSAGFYTISLFFVTLTLLAAGTAIGLATAAYTYGRYAISRNRTTLLLSAFFVFAAFGFLLPTIGELDPTTNIPFEYFYLTIGAISLTLLNISAFLALDWKTWSLTPIIIELPALLYTWLYFPLPVDAIPGRGMLTGLTSLIQTLLPLVLYLQLGYRIRKASGKGYLRPTFLGLGIIFLILGSVSGDTATIQSAVPIFLAFAIWWFGITGRADRLLGTV